jgi:hypothetical protein
MTPLRSPVYILVVLTLLTAEPLLLGQGNLEPGIPMERSIAAGQAHTYTVNLKQDQFLQLVVKQLGIDVGIRVSYPDSEQLGDFDNASGTSGTEIVSLVAEFPGQYRFNVFPLDVFANPPPGQYEIKIEDLRQATDEELKAGRTRGLRKARGLAVLDDVTVGLQEIRNPQTRVGYQIRAARLLWGSDDRRAVRLMEQAIEGVKQIIATLDSSNTGDSGDFRAALDLRQQIIDSLIPHDPELALAFIRSTPRLSNPDLGQDDGQRDRDSEMLVANQIAPNNPRRAFEIAEDVLREGSSLALLNTVQLLRSKTPDLAANLAHDILTKLANQRLLTNPVNTYLASGFLQLVRPAATSATVSGRNANAPLISDAEFRSLLQKMAAEVLSYSAPETGLYTAERNAAQIFANALKQMSGELQNLEPQRAPAVMQKLTQIIDTGAPPKPVYSADVNNVSIDAGLTLADQAPPQLRDQLYQQVANRAAKAGDLQRAREIITNHLENPARQQALNNLQRESIYAAASSGKIQDALLYIENFRSPDERVNMLTQIVGQIGPGLKKSTALIFLQRARNILGPSPRAESQEEMKALLAIGGAFSRLDSNRGLEIIEPLIDQFNDLSASAKSMNGFPEKYYRDGDLITDNGNTLAQIADQLSEILTDLASLDFQRAKGSADRIQSVSIRIRTYLAIAEKAIHSPN